MLKELLLNKGEQRPLANRSLFGCSLEYSWQGFSRFTHPTLILYCLTAGLSIAASQIFLAGILIFWIALWGRDLIRQEISCSSLVHEETRQIVYAMSLWLLCAFCAIFFGVAPERAFPECIKTILYFQFPFVVLLSLREANDSYEKKLQKIQTYLLAIAASMALAAIHTAISYGISPNLLPRTPGSVTESGQLVLVIPAAIAVYMLNAQASSFNMRKESLYSIALGLLVFASFLLFVWPQAVSASTVTPYFGGVALLTAVVFAWIQFRKDQHSVVSAILIGLLFGALVVNLKRGPWFGVLIELFLLGVLSSRKLLIAAISGSTLLLLLEPARNRVFSLLDHFVIHGGRLDMWTLGTEIAARYPLGLGLDNAEFMRLLDPSIPPTHRHMHNNLLNITVETGWLGLAVFVWWIFLVFRLAYRLGKNKNPRISLLAMCLGTALVGWQVSGLVEYNFGDGEINMIAMFFMGLLLALLDLSKLPESIGKARAYTPK